jgi:hypothetical protein
MSAGVLPDRLLWLAQCVGEMTARPMGHQHPRAWGAMAETLSHLAELAKPLDLKAAMLLRRAAAEAHAAATARPFRPMGLTGLHGLAESLHAVAQMLTDAGTRDPGPDQPDPGAGGRAAAA